MYDVLVIGAGSAGYVAASVLARQKLNVAVVEKGKFGGTCVNSGCVPSIFLFDSSFMLSRWQEIGDYKGLDVKVDFSNSTFSKRDDVVSYLSSAGRSLIENAGGHVYKGSGRIIDKGVAETDEGEKICFKKLIVASGSVPKTPPGVMSEDEAVNLEYVPKDMIVVGGGYAGVEIAQIFSRLGSSVTLITRSRIMKGFSEKAREYLLQSLEFDGVQVKEFHEVKRMSEREVYTENGTFKGEVVVSATGRTPLIPDGLKSYSINVKENGIIVRPTMMTDDPSVFAIGDVVDKPNKTAHSAMHEAIVASYNLIGRKLEVKYNCIPQVVYTDPQIGVVGSASHAVKFAEFPFNAVTRATIAGMRDGEVRIGFNEKGETVFGEVIGKNAEELINIITLAVRHKITAFELATTVFVHPSLSEGISNAAKTMFDLDIDRFK
ncbi:dihydrolipoyl dehydrogenase family protein [Sulfuracidifex metallicus]|uniref:FAD-binding protein n=1 Tax=Sulfuracidifex metallicus DSM 6482 = JCM 9184 TaxID=523847 RepID=A0A6A9QKV9_SULME|nr:NAD(P)/FAD-dependent oxidoreductase [Sulfuracidifex metallicus]MUN29897.1 FAD-binding protein [Sulfuracidifex metallicus DSM 6482 = JCM 9184]WOE51718.1 NAD(P)/FAD-dependent oxidoreductase [Sulfuracidifex metallicus DSM 6482 = JCM 9184]